MDDRTRLGDRVADAVTAWSGSWPFLGLHAVWWLLWWVFHLDLNTLTMVLSLEAIVLATLVLMSQQRAADRDRALMERQAIEVDDIDELEREDIAIMRETHEMVALMHRHMGLAETTEESE